MADITLRIIWYKLGESYKNVGSKYERFLEWYEEFSWRRVDILDMLFLGWLLVAFVVVGAINLYLRFFGLPRYRKRQQGALDGVGGSGSGAPLSTPLVKGGEKTEWLSAAVNWLYQHYNSTPEFVDTWLRALNEEAKHHVVRHCYFTIAACYI